MFTTILAQIFEYCLIPLLIAVTGYAINWFNKKTKESETKINNELHDKYIKLLNDTITNCVLATTQTYVNELKAQGNFDKVAQEIALSKTYNAVMGILTEDAKSILSQAIGDLNLYITENIEAQVISNK